MAVVLNGKAAGWCEVNIVLPSFGLRPLTVSSITYPNFARAKEHHYGQGTEPVGYVRDSLKIDEGEIVLRRDDAQAIFDAQGSVLGDGNFPLTVAYFGTGLTTITDQFFGCDFTGFQPSVAQGTDPAMVTLKWKPNRAILNGIPVVPPLSV